MSSRARVFIFRHGQTDWNLAGRIQGHLDVPLNEAGRAQARLLIRPFERLKIQAVVSSDLIRARETAEIAASTLGAPIHTDEGLREIHLGKLQGLSREEIVAQFGPEFSDRLRHHPLTDADIAWLGSESAEQVTRRALGAITRVLEANPYERIGVATHGGVIRRILQHLARDGAFPAPIHNGVLFPLSYDLERQLWMIDAQMPLL
jgi:probable phosphoglycerate mutase